MRDFRDAKAMAHALRDALKAKAVETTHSECLELVAKAFGYENWNVLAAKIEAARSCADASPVPSPEEVPDSGPPATLYCSFCGKSQHDVKKLIAGPLVYICDECVELCTEIIRDEEPLWKVFSLLTGDKNGGSDGYRAAVEHIRSRSTEEITFYIKRCRLFADRNRLLARCIQRKLAMRAGENLAEDDVLRLPEFAYLSGKTKEELLPLKKAAEAALKRSEAAARIGTSVLSERKE
jgi:hypothetical protein